jgi:pseudaminic acid synthase
MMADERPRVPTGFMMLSAIEAPPFLIAELSANHRQDLGLALETIAAAAESGASAVKFQHYKPETMTVQGAMKSIAGGTLWDGTDLYDLYREGMMPWEWTPRLVEECKKFGVEWLSSPFDKSAVDFLDELDPFAFKIASFELTDTPLIEYTASRGRPMIMSTGMATEAEIDSALDSAKRQGCTDLLLLQCNSSYPAQPEEMNLLTILDMRRKWGVPIGLSDHTTTSQSASLAFALGARVFEKHFILDRALGGPDSAFSLEPKEFQALRDDLIRTKEILGKVSYGPSHGENSSLAFRRSVWAVEDIVPGEAITELNSRVLRPRGGIEPSLFKAALGRRARVFIPKGNPIRWDDLID